ncbi:hypothetical protein COB21_03100 [Candidatus Aerophobetes bacterium]|uniref:Uncharacterized protein n=1 Tax=Aerophobetes bacterium TaxID=2030807 RepID=A0A2A4X5P6_UNCAE|nr:MAG: hypothetical protein COB21_03100 [Candidatus Aerophobetes bacterium]
MIDLHHGWNASIKPIILGFILSSVLLFAAYRITIHSHLSGTMLITMLLVLAVLSGLCQLIFFLHLGIESKPRWNMTMFFMGVFVMILLIWGSIWIMRHLDYNESLSTTSKYATNINPGSMNEQS